MASNKIMGFVLITILFNVLGQLLIVGVVTVDGDRVFGQEDVGQYKQVDAQNYTANFTDDMSETLQPAGSVEDKGDQIYRILDALSLGFIYKAINVVDTYMYGIIDILDNMFGNSLNSDVRVILFGDEDVATDTNINFGVLKLILSIMYTIFSVQLLTGTNILPRE